jgi:cell division initiation protein
MSELSPLDILGTTFSRRLHGYDPQEVHDFLSQIANQMEGLVRELRESRHAVHKLERESAYLQQQQRSVQQALLSAQESAEKTVQRAEGEAEQIVARAHDHLESARVEGQRIIDEAQGIADTIVEEATSRVRSLETLIRELRHQRREARSELLRLVETIDGVVRDDQRQEQEAPEPASLTVLRRPREERTS